MGACCVRSGVISTQQKTGELPSSIVNLQAFYTLNHTQICRKLRVYYEQVLTLQYAETQELNLQFTNIGSTQVPYLEKVLEWYVRVKTLKLWKANLGVQGMKQLVQGLRKMVELESVGVEGNNLNDEGVAALAEAVQELALLKELYVQDNDFGDKGAEALSHSLAKTPLNVLNASENRLSAAGLECILRACPKLQSLELSYNRIGAAGGQLLLTLWPSDLTRLTVTSNAIGDQLERALLTHSHKTQVLI